MSTTNSVEQTSVKTPQLVPALFLLAALAAFYFLSVTVQPGWLTYGLSAASLIVVIITALARVNDIHIHMAGPRWHIRRFGLVLAGTGAAMMLVIPLTEQHFPSWRAVLLHMGFALTWFTTPGMPPWWRFIAGKEE
jgi:hypothetical protein